MKRKRKINLWLAFFVVALFVVSSGMAAMGIQTSNENEEDDEIVTISGGPRLQSFTTNYPGINRAGQEIEFRAAAQDVDNTGALTFYYDWGDGHNSVSETKSTSGLGWQYDYPTHTYSSMGRKVPRCYVLDANEVKSNTKDYPLWIRAKRTSLNNMQLEFLDHFPLLEKLLTLFT